MNKRSKYVSNIFVSWIDIRTESITLCVGYSTSILLGTPKTNFSKSISDTGSAAASNNVNIIFWQVVSTAPDSWVATMYSVASMRSFWRTFSTWTLRQQEGFRA